MSINSAMLAGLSGLIANSNALSTISNNIANVNTVGYKDSESDFQSLITSQGETQASGGVMAASRQLITQQGVQNQTDSPLDLSISGQGFFVTTAQPTSVTASDPALFTRAGSFQVNSQGDLVNAAGLYLQGWPVNANGTVTPNPSDLNQLQTINVSQVGGAVEPTTSVGINANLESNQAISPASTAAGQVPPAAGAYDPAANSMAMYDGDNATGVQPDYSIQVPISDSQGGEHTMQVDFLKSSTPNQWYAEIVAVPASDVNDGSGLANGQIATGIVAFTPDGKLDPANTTLFNAANPAISIGASNAAAPGSGQVNWATSLGIDAQSVSFNLAATTGGLTQLDSPSVTQSINSNGTAFGNLTDVQIDENGFVNAVFSNGVTRQIAQVAIATFSNPDGLEAVSGDAYSLSQASGPATLEQPGTGGAGQIDPSTLEASTVDLSTEFTNLITTQRAYTASSKIITTADEMMQDLLNIIR